MYRVQLQAEPSFRASPSDVGRLYVRSQPATSRQPAQTVPLSTLVTVKPIIGPDTISQAIAAVQDVARRSMPPGMSYEWTGLAYQELEAGSRAGFVFALSTLFVFLVLAAQYESWLVPLGWRARTRHGKIRLGDTLCRSKNSNHATADVVDFLTG